MPMKQLRQALKEMGVSEVRSGNNFLFKKNGLATTVKQNKGCLWELDYNILTNETMWRSAKAQTIIDYFK